MRIEAPSPAVNPNKRIRKPPKIFEIPIEKKRVKTFSMPKLEEAPQVPELNLVNEEDDQDQRYFENLAKIR